MCLWWHFRHACCRSRWSQCLNVPHARLALLLLLLPLLSALQVSPGDVVTLLEDFHACSRRAFREVLEELLTAAGLEAASSMGRF